MAEIAALTARLRELSAAGAAAKEGDRERFLADKERLLARIEAETAAPAAPRVEWESVRGDDPRSYDQMMGDSAGALVAGLGVSSSRDDSAGRDAVEGPYWAEVDADRDDDRGAS